LGLGPTPTPTPTPERLKYFTLYNNKKLSKL